MYLGRDPLWYNSRKRSLDLRILGGRFTGGSSRICNVYSREWLDAVHTSIVLPTVLLRDYMDNLQPGYLGSRHHNTGILANWDGSVVKLNLLRWTKMLRSRQIKPARLTQSNPKDPFDYRPSSASPLISETHPVVLWRSFHEQGHKHSRLES